MLKQILKRGKVQGELPPHIDLDIGAALLMGPMIYRHIFGNSLSRKLPDDFANYVVDTFWAAHVLETRGRSKPKGKSARRR